jgi:hypothetical protein
MSEYEQERLDNLNAAVDEFDPDSIAEVLCNVEDGEVAMKTGFTRLIVFAGAGAWTRPPTDCWNSDTPVRSIRQIWH